MLYGLSPVQAEEPMTGNGDKPGAGFRSGPFHMPLKRAQMPQNGPGRILGTVFTSPTALGLLWLPMAPQTPFLLSLTQLTASDSLCFISLTYQFLFFDFCFLGWLSLSGWSVAGQGWRSVA